MSFRRGISDEGTQSADRPGNGEGVWDESASSARRGCGRTSAKSRCIEGLRVRSGSRKDSADGGSDPVQAGNPKRKVSGAVDACLLGSGRGLLKH